MRPSYSFSEVDVAAERYRHPDPRVQEPGRDARADRRTGRGGAVDGAADVADRCGEGFGWRSVVRLEGPAQCVDTAPDDGSGGARNLC